MQEQSPREGLRTFQYQNSTEIQVYQDEGSICSVFSMPGQAVTALCQSSHLILEAEMLMCSPKSSFSAF